MLTVAGGYSLESVRLETIRGGHQHRWVLRKDYVCLSVNLLLRHSSAGNNTEKYLHATRVPHFMK